MEGKAERLSLFIVFCIMVKSKHLVFPLVNNTRVHIIHVSYLFFVCRNWEIIRRIILYINNRFSFMMSSKVYDYIL